MSPHRPILERRTICLPSPGKPIGALVLTTLLTLSTSATADQADSLRRARELQEQGDARYGRGDFAGALKSYQESYRQAERPLRLLGMAQCYRQLRRWEEAVAHYQAYLRAWSRHSPDRPPPYLEEVRDHIARLKPLAAQARREREAASQPSSAPAPKADVIPPRAGPLPPLPSSPPRDRGRDRKATLGWIGLGATLALVATAGILYGVGLGQRGAAEERYLELGPGAGREEFDRRWAEVESAQGKITAGHVMTGLGAGALAFSLYQLLSRPKAVEPERGARLIPGPLSISLQGSF